MSYQQLIQPDLTVTGQSGFCLEMQENVWHSDHLYSFAEQAWNQNGPNHPGEQPPDACVPVYWTYFDTAANTEYGHVATWVPGRGVYSSTFNTAFGAEWYPSIQAMTDRINQIPGASGRYLGWSEVIANLTVVQGGTMVDDNITKRAYLTAEDRDLDSETGGQQAYDYWRGRPVTELLDQLYKENETFRYKANNYDTVLKKLDDLQGQQATPVPIADITPAKPLPQLDPLPIPAAAPTPADQEKVNVFVSLWRALFG